MSQSTITEALAELKTLKSRIEKRKANAMRYFARDSKLRDPLDADGGSVEFIRRERQAASDLEDRYVTIRTNIQKVNLITNMTVQGSSATIAQWLNWRREIADGQKQFLTSMTNALNSVRQQALQKGYKVADKDNNVENEIIININEKQLAEDVEKLETILGELDGKLSLINATTLIEIPD